MKMINRLSVWTFSTSLLVGVALMPPPAMALTEQMEAFVGEEPPLFDTAEAGIAAFKETMASGDVTKISVLLGLDPEKMKSFEGITERISELQDATKKLVTVDSEGDERILSLG